MDTQNAHAGIDVAFELDAGGSITVFWLFNPSTAVGTPNTGDLKLWVGFFKNTGATLVREDLVLDLAGGWALANSSGSITFFATADGTNSGLGRAGIYRMRLRMEYAQNTADAVFGGYRADSDGGNVLTGVPNLWNAAFTLQNQGYLRGGIKITDVGLSNVSLGGATPSLFAYPDTIFTRLISNFPALVADGTGGTEEHFTDKLTRGSTNSQSTNESSTTTWDATHTTAVTNAFTIGANSLDHQIDVLGDTALVAGLRWTHYSTSGHASGYSLTGSANGPAGVATGKVSLLKATATSYDNRLTIQQYMQINTLTVNTPPDGTTDSIFNRADRLSSEVGEWTFRVKNARSEGRNSISFTAGSVTLTDTAGIGAPNVREGNTLTTGTLGGAAGWLIGSGGLGGADPNFAGWSDPLPAGFWKINYTISTANATGLGTPASGSGTPLAFTLLAPNPNLIPAVEGGSARIAGHFTPGDTLGVVFSIFDRTLRQLAVMDAGPTVYVTRTTNSRTQYLGSDLNWHDLTGAATADGFSMTETVVGTSRLYSASFATPTTKWTHRDIKLVALGFVNGTPYSATVTVESVSPFSSHNRDVTTVVGTGPALTLLSDHWHVGEDLIIGMSLFDLFTATFVTPDASPAPDIEVFRFNQSTGRGQYLKADYTWANIPKSTELAATTASGTQELLPTTTSITVASTAGFPSSGTLLLTLQGSDFGLVTYTSVDATHFLGVSGGNGVLSSGAAVTQSFSATSFALTASPADGRIFTRTFTAAQASAANGWDDSDLFVTGQAFLALRRYAVSRQHVVVGDSNGHDGYALDPLGLALGGIISQR